MKKINLKSISIPDIIMWTIASAIVVFWSGIGIAIAYMGWHSLSFMGIVIAGGLMAGSFIMAVSFVAVWKLIADKLFFNGLISDYKNNRDRRM